MYRTASNVINYVSTMLIMFTELLKELFCGGGTINKSENISLQVLFQGTLS